MNEKCFCLEGKTRRWMRATVLNYEVSSKTCQVRLIDTGVSDSSQYELDCMLPWRDEDEGTFEHELLKLAPRAIRCVLIRNGDESGGFERQIEQETRFNFRDLTACAAIKCLLVRPLDLNNNPPEDTTSDSLVWGVKLFRSVLIVYSAY